MRSVRLHITGRVQGVGYRAWTIDTATRLGLRGWVRNRIDGSVEALAVGDDASVAALIDRCRHGPSAARVGEVSVTDDQDDGSVGFTPRSSI